MVEWVLKLKNKNLPIQQLQELLIHLRMAEVPGATLPQQQLKKTKIKLI